MLLKCLNTYAIDGQYINEKSMGVNAVVFDKLNNCRQTSSITQYCNSIAGYFTVMGEKNDELERWKICVYLLDFHIARGRAPTIIGQPKKMRTKHICWKSAIIFLFVCVCSVNTHFLYRGMYRRINIRFLFSNGQLPSLSGFKSNV